MQWDKTVDVLCVGSGAGGMSAAITAAEAGASVLVVEKDHKLGGVTGISSGQCWLGNNSLASAAGIADSRQETIDYLQHLSQGLADAESREGFIDGANATVDFLSETIGIPFKVVKDYPDYYYPAVEGSKPSGRYLEVEPFVAAELGEWAQHSIVTSYGPGYAYTSSQEWVNHQAGGQPIWECLEAHLSKDERCAGAGLAAHLLKAALDRKVECWMNSPAVKLIIDNGKVLGATVSTADGEQQVRARRGVLLATGGYDWNEDMVKHYETLPDSGSMCPPTVEGDHLVMAAEAGAMPVAARAATQTPIFIGYKVPGEEVYQRPSYRMMIPGAPHSIVVNRQGRRFANDSFYPDVATKVGRFDGQQQGLVNWPAWLVFDQPMLDKYGLLPFFPGQPLPTEIAQRADSIEQLAVEVGIDVAGLLAEVERFNSFCATGVDEDFDRGTVPWGSLMAGDPAVAPNPTMAPLSSGPFYALKLERVVMGVATTGLKIDKHASVINARGEVVSGLYAAGNSTAWLEIGGGYNSGIANTRGLLQGHFAARHMLA
jgi:3-oxosteroid 1-dehydrogenase